METEKQDKLFKLKELFAKLTSCITDVTALRYPFYKFFTKRYHNKRKSIVTQLYYLKNEN